MQKAFDPSLESFREFLLPFGVGDTAILGLCVGPGYFVEDLLEAVAELQSRGVVVRVPTADWLDRLLCEGSALSSALPRLSTLLDRGKYIDTLEALHTQHSGRKRELSDELRLVLKAYRLISDQGLPVVEACRKVGCKPTLYYINRNKIERYDGR